MIRRAALAAAVVVANAGPAAAHGGFPGGAGFAAGFVHPLAATEHLILLLALGLLSGQLPRERRGPGFAAVGVGLLAGMGLGNEAIGLPAALAPTAILALGCAAGLLVAWGNPRLPPALMAGLTGLAGLAVGLDTGGAGVTLADGSAGVAPAAGVVAAGYLIVLDAAALSAFAARPPYAVAIRALGSWVAAVALMLLALAAAPAAGPA